jgi:hypothetical protein
LWATLTCGWPFRLPDDFMADMRQFLQGILVLHIGIIVSLTPPEWVVAGTSVPVWPSGYFIIAASVVMTGTVVRRWFARRRARREK